MMTKPELGAPLWLRRDIRLNAEPAIVTAVNDDGTVNVAAFAAHGGLMPLQNVALRQGTDNAPAGVYLDFPGKEAPDVKKAREEREATTKKADAPAKATRQPMGSTGSTGSTVAAKARAPMAQRA